MPRVGRHAKLHCALQSHPKTFYVYGDNDLFATYARILMLAVERFAARTGNRFDVKQKELLELTGKRRIDAAKRVLDYLSTMGPVLIDYRGDSALITIPNFSEKQGFLPEIENKSERLRSPPHIHNTNKSKLVVHSEDQASSNIEQSRRENPAQPNPHTPHTQDEASGAKPEEIGRAHV